MQPDLGVWLIIMVRLKRTYFPALSLSHRRFVFSENYDDDNTTGWGAAVLEDLITIRDKHSPNEDEVEVEWPSPSVITPSRSLIWLGLGVHGSLQ